MVLDWDIHSIVEQKLRKQAAVDAKRMGLYVLPVIKQATSAIINTMDFINQDKFIIARGVEVRNTADYFIAQAAVGTLSRSHRFYPSPVSRSSPA
jgi:hypothetical protein